MKAHTIGTSMNRKKNNNFGIKKKYETLFLYIRFNNEFDRVLRTAVCPTLFVVTGFVSKVAHFPSKPRT